MTYIPILTDPTEFNGKDIQQCNVCQTDLNTSEEQEQKLCFECIEEKEERKELEKQFLKFPELEETKEKKVLNNIFDSFSIAMIETINKNKL
jgi:hypothetical protein